jgi:oligopeptidase B
MSVRAEYDTHSLRVSYESLVSPPSTLTVDMRTLERKLLRQEPVPNYDASLYAYKQLHAPARDGTLVPMTICYRKDKFSPPSTNGDKNATSTSSAAPMYLSGYGSYGYSYEPQFSRHDVVLMDHGVVCAVANVRGGGELGRTWYEDEGKYLKKLNTFTDFVDCAEYVVKKGYTSTDRLAIEGASAGGLLMGNVINLRPDLFKCVIAKVPFVDLMNTMCDAR